MRRAISRIGVQTAANQRATAARAERLLFDYGTWVSVAGIVLFKLSGIRGSEPWSAWYDRQGYVWTHGAPAEYGGPYPQKLEQQALDALGTYLIEMGNERETERLYCVDTGPGYEERHLECTGCGSRRVDHDHILAARACCPDHSYEDTRIPEGTSVTDAAWCAVGTLAVMVYKVRGWSNRVQWEGWYHADGVWVTGYGEVPSRPRYAPLRIDINVMSHIVASVADATYDTWVPIGTGA